MEEQKKNPWLGLESYKEGEVLYGRDDDIRDLTQSVLNDTDTLLYGKSGIGKSSILNAGILPAARRNGFVPVIVRLSHKGDTSYLKQITNNIVNSVTPPLEIREVVASKDIEFESLYEFFHRNMFFTANGERVKLLVIFDQFEEIFTLQSDEAVKKRFFAELADLLNDIMPANLQQSTEAHIEESQQATLESSDDFDALFNDIDLGDKNDILDYVTDNEIHLVFTIREDFLSEFEYYTASIPSLKQNRYGLRPISEEQAAQIILRPMPGLISEPVAKLIIEKVTGRKDFELDGVPEIEVDSAVLSLYLNRLYEAKAEEKITSELVEQKGGEIIADFYIDAISDISDSTIEYLEDMLLNGKGRRDNITVFDAIHDGGATEKELDALCNKKKILRQFNYAGDLRIEYVHDILCPVVKNHKEERINRKRQEEERQRIEEEREILLLEEKAKREKIAREAEEEKKKLKEEAIRIRRKNRRRLYAITVGIVAIGIVGLLIYFAKFKTYSEYYGNYTIVNGWPEGLGDKVNSDNIRDQLIVHYRLTRRGWLPQGWGGRPFEVVEVVDGNKRLCTNMFYETPVVGLMGVELDDIKAKDFANLQRKTAYWIFTPGGSGYEEGAVRCIAYSIDKEELYSIQYYRDKTFVSQDNSKYVQWAVFNDADGKQMMVTDNGVDRMRQTIKKGVVTGCLFFTELGTPQKNAYDVYGYRYEVNDSNHLIKQQCCVDKFGTRIDSTIIDFIDYRYGRVRKTSLYEVLFPKQNTIVYKFDSFSDTLVFNNNGSLGYGTFHILGGKYSQIVFQYDDKGLPLLRKKYSSGSLVESKMYTYLSKTDKVSQISVFQNGMNYIEQYEYPNDSTMILTFWMNDARISLLRYNEFGDQLYFHKSKKSISTDLDYYIETVEYSDSLDNPISSGDYAKYSISKDKKTQKNVILEYFYDTNGEICKSEWFEYDEYGNRIARAVAGIEGEPVRCPNWDWSHMCYFKMSFLKNFSDNVFVAVKGVDEFGDQSYVIQDSPEGKALYELFEMPLDKMELDNSVGNTTKHYTGFYISQNNKEYNYNLKEIPYLHILNKTGAIYNSCNTSDISIRISDGDILYRVGKWNLYDKPTLLKNEWHLLSQNGGNIDVLKPINNTYELQTYRIKEGLLGAEYHYMPITKSTDERIKNKKTNQ